jgi:hypothetical protein
MEIEQGAPDCTCKIDHYKNKFGIQICDFLDFLQEVGSNSFEFDLGLFTI